MLQHEPISRPHGVGGRKPKPTQNTNIMKITARMPIIFDSERGTIMMGRDGPLHDPDVPRNPPAISEEQKRVNELILESGGDPVIAIALACIRGHDYQFEDVYGHGFHSKPVIKTPLGRNVIWIKGDLSHILNNRPDDQYHFRIVMDEGKVRSIEVNIAQGGWGPIVGPVAWLIGRQYGVNLPADTISKVTGELEQAVQGSDWKTVADAIVAQIAMRV
jgi:hypothetical protein